MQRHQQTLLLRIGLRERVIWITGRTRRGNGGRPVLREPRIYELRDKRVSSQRMRAEPGLTNPVRAETIRELHSPMWACGAAGSALPWHGRGHRFDPDQVHQNTPMSYVYVLQSQSTKKLYIGCTAQVSGRLATHQRGQIASTLGRGPWALVYEEEFWTSSSARSRERQLEAWKSHRSIQELIDAQVRTYSASGLPGRSSVRFRSGPPITTIKSMDYKRHSDRRI